VTLGLDETVVQLETINPSKKKRNVFGCLYSRFHYAR